MTPNDHLSRMIGELVMTVAKLSADVDALREQIAAKPAPTPPETGAP